MNTDDSDALPSTDDSVLLLHNPHCSKSRATLALLEQNGIAFRERRYLERPLSVEELRELGRRLERPVREWVRTGEASFAAAGVSAGADEDALLAAIAKDPALLQRPIVVRGERARIGRPPADVLDLFDGNGDA